MDACVDSDWRDFPRFRLFLPCTRSSATGVRVFCGLLPGKLPLAPPADAILENVRMQLMPWVHRGKSTARRVVVGLTPVSSATRSQVAALRCLLTDVAKMGPVSRWPSPVFILQELAFHDAVALGQAKRLQQWLEVARGMEIRRIRCRAADTKVGSETIASAVRDLLGLEGSKAVARTRTLELSSQHTGLFHAFASALPYATSVEAVDLCYHHRQIQFDGGGVVWLGYALFHPDTPSSSWRRLALRSTMATRRSVAVLQAMSRGNNVAALLGGRQPTSDGYYQATLVHGARVVSQPIASMWQRLKTSTLLTSDGHVILDVCDVDSNEPGQWNEWVAVVVPGYGLGYIRSADVVAVRKRPPCEPPLATLHQCIGYQDDTPNVMPAVLALIGQRLVELDLGEYRPFDSMDDLKQALGCCPRVESLAIPHARVPHSLPPKLRQLQLRVKDKERSLAALRLPRSLQWLQIHAVGSEDMYVVNREGVRHILSQISCLHFFQWREVKSRPRVPPFRWRESLGRPPVDTTSRLHELGLPLWQCACLPTPFVIAFLSVLSSSGGSSARSRLDEELLKAILAFASIERVIELEPTMRDEFPGLRTDWVFAHTPRHD